MIDRDCLWNLFRFELRTVLRDRRTVFVSIVLPVIVTPLIFAASFWSENRRMERLETVELEYTVVGPEATAARELLAAWEAPAEDETPRHLVEVSPPKPMADLQAGDVLAVLEAREPAADSEGLLDVRLHFRADDDDSLAAADALEERLEDVRRARREAALLNAGFPIPPAELSPVDVIDVASVEEAAGAALGKGAAVFVMIFLLTGGSVVAADTLAGERERGTLETLLTSAATRAEILGAKMLLILSVALVISGVQIANLAVYAGLELLPMSSALDVDLTVPMLLVAGLLLVPLATLTAGILLAVSGRSASYKQFQLVFFPVFLVTVLPTAAPILPGIELRSVVVLVPLANVAVGLKEVLGGHYDLPFLALAWATSMGAAVGLLNLAFGRLTTEELVLAGKSGDISEMTPEARFSRRVPLWFAGMWVVIFLASATPTSLSTNLRHQAVFNILVVMVCGSWWAVRRYGVDLKTTLRLRLPAPPVWLAVVLGAPGSVLAGVGVFRLSSWLFPMPESLLEGLQESFSVTELSYWQVLLFLAILPGIGEELAFRGALLTAFRRRFGPAGAVVATSLVFAVFHFQLVRFLPVIWLALLVGSLTLLTRSVYPAMLWHAIYNGLLLSAEPAGFDLGELPTWMLATGALVTVLAFVLVVRVSRTPAASGSSAGP